MQLAVMVTQQSNHNPLTKYHWFCALMFSLLLAWANFWNNSWVAGVILSSSLLRRSSRTKSYLFSLEMFAHRSAIMGGVGYFQRWCITYIHTDASLTVLSCDDQWQWKSIHVLSNTFAWFWCISNNFFHFCQGFPVELYLISSIAGRTGAGCRHKLARSCCTLQVAMNR